MVVRSGVERGRMEVSQSGEKQTDRNEKCTQKSVRLLDGRSTVEGETGSALPVSAGEKRSFCY